MPVADAQDRTEPQMTRPPRSRWNLALRVVVFAVGLVMAGVGLRLLINVWDHSEDSSGLSFLVVGIPAALAGFALIALATWWQRPF